MEYTISWHSHPTREPTHLSDWMSRDAVIADDRDIFSLGRVHQEIPQLAVEVQESGQ